MVGAPLAAEAADGFHHAPRGDQESDDLPVGGMEVADVGKAGDAEAGRKGSKREEDGAGEGLLAQAEDREEGLHDWFYYRARLATVVR